MSSKTDYVISFGTLYVNIGNTAATSFDQQGKPNYVNLGLGLAQTSHSIADLTTKPLQSTSGMWGKGVPGVGAVLGVASLTTIDTNKSFSLGDYANITGGTAGVLGFGAAVLNWPTTAAVLGVVGMGAGGVQLYDAVKNPPQVGYLGKSYNDPRRLDASQPAAVIDRPYRTFADDVAARKLANQQTAMGQVLDQEEKSSLSSAIDVSESSKRSQAKIESDRRAAEAKAAAEAQARALVEAFRASEIAYTNSSSSWRSESNEFGGYNGWAGNTTEGSGFGMGEHGGSLAPIIIDLDGNGIDLYLNGHSSACFDADDDGYAETTAWAGPQDGILVIDEGNDNQITQSKEIAFAKWTAAEGDTDLEGLAATFDSNHDGVLDARDARYADFKVWKDANSNGNPPDKPKDREVEFSKKEVLREEVEIYG
ncbi:hypothetical protein RAE19_18310 [Rhodoferax sp. TBRC 17660]|uniref:EF-hand domain-containing protein n=1 Tax=Rhodoferax potami TaxID=3068338 RepID=A0ABU3KS39_9BURK|nr:hypothetical protein [Rhodoferax sp. TBRC 17660]MDT7520620.1 hypothetical protein [Rhodoferax sp. TBRC 17660]